jgi:hypothetical protein
MAKKTRQADGAIRDVVKIIDYAQRMCAGRQGSFKTILVGWSKE